MANCSIKTYSYNIILTKNKQKIGIEMLEVGFEEEIKYLEWLTKKHGFMVGTKGEKHKTCR